MAHQKKRTIVAWRLLRHRYGPARMIPRGHLQRISEELGIGTGRLTELALIEGLRTNVRMSNLPPERAAEWSYLWRLYKNCM